MGTKNISISEEAYQMLNALKKSGESFTEVIERITRKSAVLDLAGIMSGEKVARIEKSVKDLRGRSSRRIRRTTKELGRFVG